MSEFINKGLSYGCATTQWVVNNILSRETLEWHGSKFGVLILKGSTGWSGRHILAMASLPSSVDKRYDFHGSRTIIGWEDSPFDEEINQLMESFVRTINGPWSVALCLRDESPDRNFYHELTMSPGWDGIHNYRAKNWLEEVIVTGKSPNDEHNWWDMVVYAMP